MYLHFKRGFDLICASLALICFFPLFLLIMFGQKCLDPGSIFFSQERIGKQGKAFLIYKFRTIKTHNNNECELFTDISADRISLYGRFLRKTHLDELPQLWNILKGDMSVIGYRPERAHFIAQILERDPRYTQLYTMRPGLSSKASVINGYTDTIDKMLIRLEMDLAYLEECSFTTDLHIIWMTIKSILKGK